jgi:hypothetical protein
VPLSTTTTASSPVSSSNSLNSPVAGQRLRPVVHQDGQNRVCLQNFHSSPAPVNLQVQGAHYRLSLTLHLTLFSFEAASVVVPLKPGWLLIDARLSRIFKPNSRQLSTPQSRRFLQYPPFLQLFQIYLYRGQISIRFLTMDKSTLAPSTPSSITPLPRESSLISLPIHISVVDTRTTACTVLNVHHRRINRSSHHWTRTSGHFSQTRIS